MDARGTFGEGTHRSDSRSVVTNYQILIIRFYRVQKLFAKIFSIFFSNNIMIDLRNISNKIKIRDQSLIKCSTSSADKAKTTIFKRIITCSIYARLIQCMHLI